MKASELEALGRRVVACPRWRWMPGMLLLWKLHERGGTYEGRVCHLGGSDSGAGKDVYCEGRGDRFDGVLEVPKCFPDLSDPATIGCLLALVRIAYGDPSFVVRCVAGLWYEESNRRALVARGSDTEAEAIVVALEAAP